MGDNWQTWYLRLFWETTWRALTCTAFTALFEESTNPLVIDPTKLGWAGLEVPSGESLEAADFGDKFKPKPLVKRAKADFPAALSVVPSCEADCGWEIFKFLAHEVMPLGDSLDGASRVTLSIPVVAGAWGCTSGGLVSEELTVGDVEESVEFGSMIWLEIVSRTQQRHYPLTAGKIIIRNIEDKEAFQNDHLG